MKTLLDIDPATGETLAEIQPATPDEITAAVARSRASQALWGEVPLSERARLLIHASVQLEKRADELGRLMTQEMGKPYPEARREVRGSARRIPDLMVEIELALAPETRPGKGCETLLVRDPLGVVAAITPWNFPVAMPLDILMPALAAGNTVVFKPSEEVPLTGRLLAEILSAVLPKDVLTVLQGAGDVGAALVAADVDMIGFVGSRVTGKAIMQSASSGLKRLVLELGGKDPLIVMGDADLDAAAECAVQHSLRNAGQVCCSVERVYVDEGVAERFEDLVLEKAKRWNHGNGFEEGVKMGPLVSAKQREKVARQVDLAVEGGARLLLGGVLPDGEGWFYPATVLAGVEEGAPITREETFGPVVCLTRFSGTEDDAVRLANDTPYGLGSNVYTADLERGRRIARRIRSGQVGVNRYLAGSTGLPWVGARQSGFGFLGGADGHRQFTIPKSISYPVDEA